MTESYVYDYGVISALMYYLLHSSFIYKPNSDNFFQGVPGIWIVGMIVLFIATIALFRNWNFKNKPMQLWFMFGTIAIIVGIIYSSQKIENESSEQQELYLENNKIKTLLSLVAFIVTGFIAYNVINDAETCNANPELLCDKSFIVTFTLVAYACYYIIKIFKDFSLTGFIKDSEPNTVAEGIVNTIILSIWQFYLYMVMDGFRYGTVHKEVYSQLTTGGSQSSIKYLVYMSIIYILFSFSMHVITTKTCDKWNDIEKINNIKEIQANIVTTSIVAILMIFSISN